MGDSAGESSETATGLLVARSIVAGYGKKQVLNGVTVQIGAGEIVALIGHNGAGKSTLLKAIFGMIPLRGGHVFLDGNRIDPPAPPTWLRQRVAYAPQGNRVFSDLTVRDNLEIGGISLPAKHLVHERVDQVLDLFPVLRRRFNRPAAVLSGGERQMLAFANVLVSSPRLVLLDEPSLGLAPPLVAAVFKRIEETRARSGTAFLIVEQKVRDVLTIAHRFYVLRNGLVSFSGSAKSPVSEAEVARLYM